MPVAPVGPRAASIESAARREIARSRSSPSARCQATPAWIRWPKQYSSWPNWRSLYSRPGREDLDERVQVAVVALGRGDRVDRLVGHRGHVGIPGPAELPGRPLEPLVDVRVEERERPIEHDAEGLVLATGTRGEAQVVQVARLDELAEDVRQGLLAVQPEPLGPEPARDPPRPDRPAGADDRWRRPTAGPTRWDARRGRARRRGRSWACSAGRREYEREHTIASAAAARNRRARGAGHLTAPVSRPDT